MRLWTEELFPYLPDLQFKGQLREVVVIMRDWRDKGTTNHLLVNKVMEYPKNHLFWYFVSYAEEYEKRYGIKINKKYYDEFWNFLDIKPMHNIRYFSFCGWHDKEYLRVCMANLYEKHFFGAGKSRISDEEWERLCEGYKRITGEEYHI